MTGMKDFIVHTVKEIKDIFGSILAKVLFFYISYKAKKLLSLISTVYIDGVKYLIESRDTINGKLKLFSKDKGYLNLEQDILLSAIKGALEKQTNPFVLNDKDVQLTSLNIIKEKVSKPLADFINIKNKRVTLDFKSIDK
jgi:hypothetical protein